MSQESPQDVCRRYCAIPNCGCVDPEREAAIAEMYEDDELQPVDPREAIMNAWDGERAMPVL